MQAWEIVLAVTGVIGALFITMFYVYEMGWNRGYDFGHPGSPDKSIPVGFRQMGIDIATYLAHEIENTALNGMTLGQLDARRARGEFLLMMLRQLGEGPCVPFHSLSRHVKDDYVLLDAWLGDIGYALRVVDKSEAYVQPETKGEVR